MPVPHKFLNEDFRDGFETESAILSSIPYKPEVLILGTFNPATPNANFADFFYGRNYFWTCFKRLREPNYVFVNQRRMPANGAPQLPLDPPLFQIKEISQIFSLSFTDLIVEVLHNGPIEYHFLPNDNVIFQGQEFNLIQDNAQNGVQGLADLHQLGQVNWNTENIINYLIRTPSIKHIYFTRQPNGIWGAIWDLISNHPDLQDRNFTNILSPAHRKPDLNQQQFIPNQNPNNRINTTLHYWIWNGVHNPNMEDLFNPNFGHLDHDWLIRSGVDINLF